MVQHSIIAETKKSRRNVINSSTVPTNDKQNIIIVTITKSGSIVSLPGLLLLLFVVVLFLSKESLIRTVVSTTTTTTTSIYVPKVCSTTGSCGNAYFFVNQRTCIIPTLFAFAGQRTGNVAGVSTTKIQHNHPLYQRNLMFWSQNSGTQIILFRQQLQKKRIQRIGSIHSFSTTSTGTYCNSRDRSRSRDTLLLVPLISDFQSVPRLSRTDCFAVSSVSRVNFWRIATRIMSTSDGTTTTGSTGTSGSIPVHNNEKDQQSPMVLVPEQQLRFMDIGANLLDERFIEGTYRGTYRHPSDLDCIIERAINVGVQRILLTAGTIDESQKAVETVRLWKVQYPQIQFACTVGVHPTRCQQVFGIDTTITTSTVGGTSTTGSTSSNDDVLLQRLVDIAIDGMSDKSVVAVGEIGLDYDRLEFSPMDVQKKYFIKQLQIVAKRTGLPLFLHNRNVGNDLYDILLANRDCWENASGVVHSFDDTIELGMKFINELNLYIGLNGCSLRTADNIRTVSQIPLSKILLETDCPYCDVRSTHAGYEYIQTKFESKPEKKFEYGMTVKNRQEPCHIIQIAEIVSKCHNVPVQEVATITYQNSCTLFFNGIIL